MGREFGRGGGRTERVVYHWGCSSVSSLLDVQYGLRKERKYSVKFRIMEMESLCRGCSERKKGRSGVTKVWFGSSRDGPEEVFGGYEVGI